MKVGEFTLVNPEKVERALNGSLAREGTMIGGVAKDDGTYEDSALLAEYDRLGGLILRDGDKIKMGSFYDFHAKRPRAKAEVIAVFQINGKTVELKDGAEPTGVVRAARQLAAAEAEELEAAQEAFEDEDGEEKPKKKRGTKSK